MNRRNIITIAAMTVLGLALLPGIAAHAETLQPVAHPEELGFDATRPERLTKAFQGYVDTVLFRQRTVTFMQGINFWVSGAGSMDRGVTHEDWQVRRLP